MRKPTGNEKKSPGGSDLSDAISIAFSAGIVLLLSIGLGGACGYGLDILLDTAPWLLVVGCLLGGAGGMYTIYRRAIGQ